MSPLRGSNATKLFAAPMRISPADTLIFATGLELECCSNITICNGHMAIGETFKDLKS